MNGSVRQAANLALLEVDRGNVFKPDFMYDHSDLYSKQPVSSVTWTIHQSRIIWVVSGMGDENKARL